MNRELMESETGEKFGKVNQITFNSVNYKNKDELFQAVATIMRILTDNGYICSFGYDDCGIYILKFDHDDCCAEFELKWIDVEP